MDKTLGGRYCFFFFFPSKGLLSWEEGALLDKNDQGADREFRNQPLQGTGISFCGCPLKFIFTS